MGKAELRGWEAARNDFNKRQYQRVDSAIRELGSMTEDELYDRYQVPVLDLEERLLATRSKSVKELSAKLAYAKGMEDVCDEQATAMFMSAADDARLLGADA